MQEQEWLAQSFETHRAHLRGVAYRMLGSLSETDDAVQEAWLRLSRSDAAEVENLRGWLTTVVARICLDVLRSRRTRGEEPLATHIPDPIVSRDGNDRPDAETMLADSVGLALLVVLETLAPAERLAFVLHDLFGVPFEEIAPLVERTPANTRQLASRARRRVQQSTVASNANVRHQRKVVDAFLVASRTGDFEALLNVLDPGVVLRLDRGAGTHASKEVHGAENVVNLGFRFAGDGWITQPVLVNGSAGVIIRYNDKPFSVVSFAIDGDRITRIDILADFERLAKMALPQ